jgi:hypothetical protein
MSETMVEIEAKRLYNTTVLIWYDNLPVLDSVKAIETAALYDPFLAMLWRACLDRVASPINPIEQGPMWEMGNE